MHLFIALFQLLTELDSLSVPAFSGSLSLPDRMETPSRYRLILAALTVLGAVLAGCVRWRLRLTAVSLTLGCTTWYGQCIGLWSRVPMGRWSSKSWAHAGLRRWAATPVPLGELRTA